MNKGCRNENASAKVADSEEELRWKLQSWDVLCQSWERTGRARDDQDDKHGPDLERRVVLIPTRIVAATG